MCLNKNSVFLYILYFIYLQNTLRTRNYWGEIQSNEFVHYLLNHNKDLMTHNSLIIVSGTFTFSQAAII